MSTQAVALPGMDGRRAYDLTEEVIRQNSKTFYFATQLLPHFARKAVRVLYGFCRASDDLVDRREATVADVEAWRAAVDLPLERQTDPILFAWTMVRDHFHVNRQYEQELLDGIEKDLAFQPYATWKELEQYCYQVASTVGLLSIPIIGVANGSSFEEAAPFAVQLGIALQLTNILRDVGEDLQYGRMYLPLEDLYRFGLKLEDLYQRVYDTRFIQLMKFEIERARQYYRASLPGIKLLNPAAQPAVGAAALLYEAILDEIERNQYQVYEKRAHTSGLRKISMLPEIFIKIWGLKKPRVPMNFETI
jgi:phytoene synthase